MDDRRNDDQVPDVHLIVLDELLQRRGLAVLLIFTPQHDRFEPDILY